MNSSKRSSEMWAGDDNIKGSPYLTEDFVPSMLQLERKWYEHVDLKYNIYEDHFVVRFETGILIIDPMKNDIDSIKHNGEIFIRKVYESGKKMRVAYMSLLGVSNSYSICKQYQKDFIQATKPAAYSDAKPAEYKSAVPNYYVFKENKMWTVKGTKDIAEIFETDNKQVKNYLKKNRYKLKNEKDLVHVVSYFSNL